MVLQARHTVTVGKSGKIIRNSQPQVINDEDLILIGNCTYAFEYTSHFRSVEFEAELTQYVQQTCGPRWTINKIISPASVGEPMPLRILSFAQCLRARILWPSNSGMGSRRSSSSHQILQEPKEKRDRIA